MEYRLLIAKEPLFWIFRVCELRYFFETKGWWKDGIYWLLKSSCFKLFGDGKYGLLCDKTLMERWYFLITENFLFWIFLWWEILSFFSQKVDVKIIFTWSFLGFLCYSRTWETWFLCSDICRRKATNYWWIKVSITV